MFGRILMLFALRRNIRLTWRLFKDGRVPFSAKLPLPLALLYVLSPVDVAPDLLPLLGQVDDLTIILVTIALFLKLAPPEVVREHLEVLAGRRRPERQAPGEVIEGEYRVIN